MQGARDIQRLRDGGFSDAEIGAYVAEREEILRGGGFTDDEIAKYFGRGTVDTDAVAEHFQNAWTEQELEDFDLGDAFMAGMEHSVGGMLARQDVPKTDIPSNLPMAKRIVSQVGTLTGDLPFMAIGALMGVAPGGGIGSAVTGTAGAFALPAGLRSVLMDSYEQGGIEWEDFWASVAGAAWETFKGYTTGAATGATGFGARGLVGAAQASGPGAFAQTVAPRAAPLAFRGAESTAAFASEVATMTAVGAALEGRVPTREEFTDAAIVMAGFKAIKPISKQLRETYRTTGRRPAEVVKDAEVAPSIPEDLASKNIKTPRVYEEPKPVEVAERVAPAERAAPKGFEGDTPEARVFSRIATDPVGGKKAGIRQTLHNLHTDIFDQLHPLKQAVDAMRRGDHPEKVSDFYRQARLLMGAKAKSDHFLEHSPFKFETFERVGKPLRQILEPVGKELDLFRTYLVSKRAIELSERPTKDGKPIETGIPLEDARAVVAKHGPKMEAAARELVEYQNHSLQYLRDAGLISAEQFDTMTAANREYVPFYRLFEDPKGQGAGSGMKTRNPIFRIKGSEREIIDPLESIIKNTYLYVELAERNHIGRMFVDSAEASGLGEAWAKRVKRKQKPIRVGEKDTRKLLQEFRDGKLGELSKEELQLLELALSEEFTIFRPGELTARRNQLSVYRDGTREVWDIDPKIYEAVSAADAASASMVLKLLAVPSRALRAGAILAPEFIGRNPLRDQLSAFILSKGEFRPFLDFGHGVFNLVGKTKLYQDWLMSGGPMATMVSLDRAYLQKNIRQLAGQTGMMDHVRNVARSPLDVLAAMSEAAEQATRIGEFRRVTRGKPRTRETIEEGGFASREVTLDFGRIGARTAAMNQITAFFNAHLQGMEKTVRNMKDHPAEMSARIAVSITLPSIILHMMNREEEWYKDMPQWQKDLFWLVPQYTDSGSLDYVMRIPKPFEMGLIFGTGAERMIDWIAEQEDGDLSEYMGTVRRAFTPSIIPTFAIPMLETTANYSFFRERPLIPKRLEGVFPEYQYTDYTTETSKAFGKLISRVPVVGDTRAASPVVLDNWIRAWSGGIGTHLLSLADDAMEATGIIPDRNRPTRTLADIPFVKAFVVRHPSASAEPIQDFFDNYNKNRETIRTFNLLKERDVEAAIAFQNAHLGSMYSLEDLKDALSTQFEYIHRINQYPADQMSPQEKRQIIDETYTQMIQMAKQGNRIVREVKRAMRDLEREEE